MLKVARWAWLFPVLAAWPAVAQTWDTSGNSMLQGTYYYREVIWVLGDQYGDLGQAIALYGNLSFNGSGTFTMTAVTVADSSAGYLQQVPATTTGTYSISASGYGFIKIPIYGGYTVWGLVSQQGIFVGSATEAGINNMFIAAPLSSPAPTNATFKGSYTMAAIDLSGGSPEYASDYTFQLTPDGAGNLGNVLFSGYIGEGGSSQYTQTLSTQKYSFSNGGCNLAFPNNNNANFVSGNKYLYISPDGNFVFGGSPVDFDFFVGVRTGTGTPNFGGLYYEAGVDENDSMLGDGYGLLDTYYGSLNAGNGLIWDHERTFDPLFSTAAYGGTYSDSYSVGSNGTYKSGAMNYVVGAGGAVRIGWGIGPYLGINVALAAPGLTPSSGVYLNPTGVLNAASNAPFTSGIAPGELLTLYGTNLAPGLAVASAIPFPTLLGNVQVTIAGLPAPIYYVSPTQISVIVPYAVTGTTAQVKVINNGTASNAVITVVNQTAPGVFTQNESGLGYGAVTHLDGTLVTPSSPAQINETLSAYLTGLGSVSPLIPDGSAGPVDPLSQTTNTISVDVNGTTATVGYAGLAPGLAGLYQINFTVPTGLTAGDNSLDIQGPDSYASQALISVSTTSTAALAPEIRAAGVNPLPHRFPKVPEIRPAPPAPLPAEPRLVTPAWRTPVRLHATGPASR